MLVFISLLSSFPFVNNLVKSILTEYPISIRELDDRDSLCSKATIPKMLIFSLCLTLEPSLITTLRPVVKSLIFPASAPSNKSHSSVSSSFRDLQKEFLLSLSPISIGKQYELTNSNMECVLTPLALWYFPITQKWKLRRREVKWLQGQDWSHSSQVPEPTL